MDSADYVWLSGQCLFAWLTGYGLGQAVRYYTKFFESAVD